jgi:hypothetical protein
MRGDRQQQRQPRRGNDRNQQRYERSPLEWQVVKTVEHGSVRAVVSRAHLDNGGSRYSFKIGKKGREDPDRLLAFIDGRDINDAALVLEDVEDFLEGGRT